MCIANSIAHEVIDTLHGIEVPDPFRWLEDRTLPETAQWIEREQHKCDAYFDDVPEYRAIKEEIRRRLDVEVVDQPARIGERYFFRRKGRGEERARIFVRDATTGEDRLLAEPDSDDPHISIGIYRISPDGTIVAFYKQRGGSDKRSVHFVDTTFGRLLPIELPSGYLRGLVFTPHLDGIFYCQEEAGLEHTIRFRSLLEDQQERVVFACERQGASKLSVFGHGKILGATFVAEQGGGRHLDFWLGKMEPSVDWTRAFAQADRGSLPLLYQDRLYLLRAEPRSGPSLTECDFQGNVRRVIVPAQAGWIQQIAFVGHSVYLTTQSGTKTLIHEWGLDSPTGRRLEGFERGTVKMVSDTSCSQSLFFTQEDYCEAPKLYEYCSKNRHATLWHESEGYTPQVEVICRETTSPGVGIPVTLIKREDTTCRAFLVTPYGSFGTAVVPQYSAFMSLLLETGFVIVIPHVRGGGERGPEWHAAGRRGNKLNSVTDLICVVRDLCSFEETDSAKVALYGASGGGLLVAAAAMRDPALFRVVVSIGPLLDMVRYDKFGRARRWIEEFGTSDREDDLRALLSYSPYHNVPTGGTIPAFLFVTGDEDDRCDAAHVRKMAARLEQHSDWASRVIVDYSEHRGHSLGLPIEDRVESLAKRCIFLCREMGLSPLQGGLQ